MRRTSYHFSIISKGELGDRMRSSPHLQRIVARVTACGPRPVSELLVELLEHAKADPRVLDRLEAWARLDPGVCRALGADRFPRVVDLVPKDSER